MITPFIIKLHGVNNGHLPKHRQERKFSFSKSKVEIYKNVSLSKSNSSRGSPGKEVDLTRQNSILTADFFECWPCHIQRPIIWEVFMSSRWNFQGKEQKKWYLRNYRICNEILLIFSAVELSLNFPIFLGVLKLPCLTI